MADPDMERKDAEIDGEVGVAVVFDEEEGFEVRDEEVVEEGGEGDKDTEAAGSEDGEDVEEIKKARAWRTRWTFPLLLKPRRRPRLRCCSPATTLKCSMVNKRVFTEPSSLLTWIL